MNGVRMNGAREQAQPKAAAALAAQEHEEAVVAMAMVDITAIDRVAEVITARDFADDILRQVWCLLLDFRESGSGQPDPVSIKRMLVGAKIFEQFGGNLRLGQMFSNTANASMITYHAKQILSASHRRRLTNFARQLYARATDPAHETHDTAAWASAAMDTYSTNPTEAIQSIGQAAGVAIDRIIDARSRKESIGKRTGLHSIDNITGGLFPGELTVLAARTSVGKTACATQIAFQMALAGAPALMVSLEMEQWEVAIRVLAAETGVEVRKLRAAAVNDEELTRLVEAKEAIDKVPFSIWRPYRANTRQIRARSKLMQATRGLSMLVVDYISLVQPEDRRMPRHEQVGGITKDLKAMAGELNIPVMALAQINRSGEGKEPTLSELKESGSIEEDANNVWLLHRPSRDSEEAKLNIAKSRNGATGGIELHYSCEQTLFSDPPMTDSAF